MVDTLFTDARLAEVYDALCDNESRDDFAFHLEGIKPGDDVLDVGCGTGEFLARVRENGNTGRLCGIDPAPAMIARARRHEEIEWHVGDIATAPFEAEFDRAVMTGHVFQVFLDDDETRAVLRGIHRALRKCGRVAFESRNPTAREWRRWTIDDDTVEVAGPTGDIVRYYREVDSVDGELVRFTHTYTCLLWDEPLVSTSTLRFPDAATIERLLGECGFEVESIAGDWRGGVVTDASAEIVVVARRG